MLDDMIQEEPPVTLQRQYLPLQVDADGLPMHNLANTIQVAGRLVILSARQVEMWRTLGVQCEYEFITFESTIRNGDYLKTEDGRTFRVVGVGHKRYTKGSIETYYKYPLQETRQT